LRGSDGVEYQFLSKYCPAFHSMVTALGLRNLRKHWGPINRREATLNEQADQLFQAVESLIAKEPEPEPEPEPTVPTITVTIDPPGSARVVIVGGA
jgi:cytochrome c1